jgi:glycosyltransferase involved in cell wall biosynthesis
MARVFIIASLADSLINFRGDLIRHLRDCGHEVVAAAPGEAPEVDSKLKSWGVRRLLIGLDRTGLNLFADIRLLLVLCRLISLERPDVVLCYTIKPVVYGALAARWAGVPKRAVMITGLGFAFAPSASLRQWVVRGFARLLYRAAMICSDTVFFQNPDDEADFRRFGLLRRSQRIVQIGGSGVNLHRFAAMPLPDGPLRFLMIARLLEDKGVREFLQAAALVRRVRPALRFHLVGPFEVHPSALSRAEVMSAINSGTVSYHGATSDVRPYLADCHVFVLPSYREGTPRSVLEAMAVGRPVITTDTPGCRETVVQGKNGFLVAPQQVEPLALAMLQIANMPQDEILRMAESSRAMVEARFDVNIVNAQIARTLAL